MKNVTQVFRVLAFAALAQRTVWCQYFSDSAGDGHRGGGHNDELHEEHQVSMLSTFMIHGYYIIYYDYI